MVGSTIELCSTCLFSYLSACIWATRRYPQAVILRSSQFLDAFRFLSSRFRPDCFSAGLVLLARSCMLSLVPILVQDGLVLQIIFTSSLIMCFFSMVCIWWYWHGNVVNCLDAFVFVNLANMMLCGALVSDAQADLGQIKMVGSIVIGSTIVILSVFLLTPCAYGICRLHGLLILFATTKWVPPASPGQCNSYCRSLRDRVAHRL